MNNFEALYISSGSKGRDAAMECHRLICQKCGGFQESCTCSEEEIDFDTAHPPYEYECNACEGKESFPSYRANHACPWCGEGLMQYVY